jgi:hypothetical protein
MVLVSKPTLLTAFREEGVWDLIFSENCFYFGSSVEDMQFHIVAEVQNEDINGNTEPTDSESLYLSDVNILQLEAISFLEYAATLNENKYNLVLVFLLCYIVSLLFLSGFKAPSKRSVFYSFSLCSQNAQHCWKLLNTAFMILWWSAFFLKVFVLFYNSPQNKL